MPAMQTAMGTLNRYFSLPEIREIPPALYDPGASVIDATRELLSREERLGNLIDPISEAVNGIPSSMRESLRALIHHNLTLDNPLPMTFAWAPAYDYEFTVWETADERGTPGGITVLFRSPHRA